MKKELLITFFVIFFTYSIKFNEAANSYKTLTIMKNPQRNIKPFCGQQYQPSHPIQERNFLRFGKKSTPLSSSIENEEKTNIRGLNRRDYREFVRFGRKKKNNWEKKSQEPSNMSYDNAIEKRRDDFLRFGKSVLVKKSNDFLRFG